MKIKNGKLYTDRLEINVVHHCNMSCRGCSHLSPILPEHFATPEEIFRDLSTLSGYCRPERISLLGGEPLLHRDLLEVIHAVRRSGISSRIRVVTNGLLLDRMPERFWSSVDEIHLSLYPWHTFKAKQLAAFKALAKRNSASLVLRYQDHFREVYSERRIKGDSLAGRIYSTCRVAREDSCHVLEGGYYYKCPQAALIPLANPDCAELADGKDGICIRDAGNLPDRLARYFASETPLAACHYCLGSVGKRFAPRQESPRPVEPLSGEELVDWDYLEKLERKRGLPFTVLTPSAGRTANTMISRLPVSILLSPRFRRILSALSVFRHKYLD